MRRKNINNQTFYSSFGKRIFDLLMTSMALLVLWPIFIILAILVYFKLGSPVIFVQIRPGKNEQTFKLYKFKTMLNQQNNINKNLTDEERLTNFGRKLRATSLDELPELINIFKGEMSLVGPRPLLLKYLPYYTTDEKQRHQVKPGLTGLAQINGRNLVGWNQRLKFDQIYVDKISFRLDLTIILQTIIKVFKRADVVSGNDHVLRSLDYERSEE